jgi:hypothetical protein
MTILTVSVGWLARLLCSRRAPGSNTSLKTGYPEGDCLWFPSPGSGAGQAEGCREHGNEPLGSTTREKFLN